MLDSTGFAELVDRRRFLFHLVWDADDSKLESVLANGLERGTPQYAGFWESRPGHVYLGDEAKVSKLAPARGDRTLVPRDLLRVDLTLLDRRRINPDEDHFLTQDFRASAKRIAGKFVCQHFRREWPPSGWLWEWATYLKLAPLPSLGEWADAVDLGSDPAETRYSVTQGSIAYDGVIPPAALSLVATSREPTDYTERLLART